MNFLLSIGAGTIGVLLAIWTAVTTRGPIGWFRNLFYIVGYYRSDLQMLANGVDSCRAHTDVVERYVKKATKVHLDIPASMEHCTKVVVIGTYRGKDHVQTFTLRPGSIHELIDQLKEMQRYAQIEFVDAPSNVSATVKRSLIL